MACLYDYTFVHSHEHKYMDILFITILKQVYECVAVLLNKREHHKAYKYCS